MGPKPRMPKNDDLFRQTDIAYVASQIGVQINDVNTSVYDKATYLRHQRVILDYFGFAPFDAVARVFAKHEILIMLRVQSSLTQSSWMNWDICLSLNPEAPCCSI